jgi:LPXTG-motif cell wall-anchored protein
MVIHRSISARRFTALAIAGGALAAAQLAQAAGAFAAGGPITFDGGSVVSLNTMPASLSFEVPNSGKANTDYTVTFAGLPAGLAVQSGAAGTNNDTCKPSTSGGTISYSCVHVNNSSAATFPAQWMFVTDKSYRAVRGGYRVGMTLTSNGATRTGELVFNTTNAYSQNLVSDVTLDQSNNVTSGNPVNFNNVNGLLTTVDVGNEGTLTNTVVTMAGTGVVPDQGAVTLMTPTGKNLGTVNDTVKGDTATVSLGNLPAGTQLLVYVPMRATADKFTVNSCVLADQTDATTQGAQNPCESATYTGNLTTGTPTGSSTAGQSGGQSTQVPTGTQLAHTGASDTMWFAAGAALLLVAGGGTYLAARRGRRATR